MIWKVAVLTSIPWILMASALALAADDKAFITQAIQGDNSEIALSRLAMMKGGDRVKEFGSRLMTDHSKDLQEARRVASARGVTPPEGISVQAALENTKLRGLSGAQFDKEFAEYMIEDHRQELGKVQNAANQGSGDVADYARKSEPVLQQHLAIAEGLVASEEGLIKSSQ